MKETIAWGLGTGPSAVASPGGHYGEQCDPGPTANGCFMAELLTHSRFQGVNSTANIIRQDVNFGEYITGSLYFRADAGGATSCALMLERVCL